MHLQYIGIIQLRGLYVFCIFIVQTKRDGRGVGMSLEVDYTDAAHKIYINENN